MTSRDKATGYLPEKFRADRHLVMAAVASYGDRLALADEKLRDDREVVLAAVRNRPQALRWASLRMRRDPEVAMEAVRRWGHAIQFVDPSNPSMTDLALEALRKDPSTWSHLVYGGPLFNDATFLRKAVSLSPQILRCVPIAIRKNEALFKEILLAALDKNEAALAQASGAILADPDFILRAGEKRFYALAYAAGRAAKDPRVLAMKDDRERVERSLKQGSWYGLGAASVRLQTDLDLIKKVIASCKAEPKYVGQNLHPSVWKDRKVVMDLLKAGPRLLAGAPWRIRSDRELVLVAVGQDGAAFAAVDRVLREDREVVLAALKSRPDLTKEILLLARGGVQWDDEVRKHVSKNKTKASNGRVGAAPR